MSRLFNRWPYAAMWLWTLVPVAAYIAWNLIGTPHVLYSYTYSNMTQYKTSCSYVRWNDTPLRLPSRYGTCPVIRFVKPEDAR